MKIAVIGHKRVPSREGGIEKSVEKQMLRLRDRGHEVVFYNRSGHNIFGAQFDDRPDSRFDGTVIRTVFTPKRVFGVPVYSFLATVRALRDGCDILYYHASGPCVMINVAKIFHAKCAAMLHGIDSRRAKWSRFGRWYLEKGEHAAAKRADVCFVLSEHMRQELKERYGAESVLVFNGTEAPSACPEGAALIRERFGLEEDGYILAMERLVPEKGLQYLIPAFRRCQTEKKLVIAGGADPGCPHFAEELSAMAADDPRILFTGFVREPYVTALYQNASVFALPSDLEGMAHSLLEAMACGCRCLVSDIPENTSVTGPFGTVFRHGDAADLREKLQALLDEERTPEEEAARRQETASYILGRYPWDGAVRIIEDALAKAVRG